MSKQAEHILKETDNENFYFKKEFLLNKLERVDDWVVYSKIKMVQLMICLNMMNIISWHPFMFSQSKVVPLTIVFNYLYSLFISKN